MPRSGIVCQIKPLPYPNRRTSPLYSIPLASFNLWQSDWIASVQRISLPVEASVLDRMDFSGGAIAMPKRVAIYARYSSHEQDGTSTIESQIRERKEHALKQGWQVLDEHIYVDEAKSGTTVNGSDAFTQMIAVAPGYRLISYLSHEMTCTPSTSDSASITPKSISRPLKPTMNLSFTAPSCVNAFTP